jgi:hypothetical protein
MNVMGEERPVLVSMRDTIVRAQTADTGFVNDLVQRVRQLEQLLRVLEDDNLVFRREIAHLRSDG